LAKILRCVYLVHEKYQTGRPKHYTCTLHSMSFKTLPSIITLHAITGNKHISNTRFKV